MKNLPNEKYMKLKYDRTKEEAKRIKNALDEQARAEKEKIRKKLAQRNKY